MGRAEHFTTLMVDFHGINVGQYTSPMDGMEVFVNHRCMLHGWMYCLRISSQDLYSIASILW